MPSVPLRTHGIDPAELPRSWVECRPFLDVQVTRQQPPEERKAAVEATLDGLPEAQLQLWTDGAAEGGTKNGGAGYVVLGREGGEIDGWTPGGQVHVFSYGEQVAIIEGLR